MVIITNPIQFVDSYKLVQIKYIKSIRYQKWRVGNGRLHLMQGTKTRRRKETGKSFRGVWRKVWRKDERKWRRKWVWIFPGRIIDESDVKVMQKIYDFASNRLLWTFKLKKIKEIDEKLRWIFFPNITCKVLLFFTANNMEWASFYSEPKSKVLKSSQNLTVKKSWKFIEKIIPAS